MLLFLGLIIRFFGPKVCGSLCSELFVARFPARQGLRLSCPLVTQIEGSQEKIWSALLPGQKVRE